MPPTNPTARKVEFVFNGAKFTADIRDATGGGSLREMAARIGMISASTLSRLENDQAPDMNTFMVICGALELNPGEYFDRIVWERQS